MCSERAGNSGSTPRYTSKNSSEVGLSRENICIAEISKPSSKIESIISPARPAATTWGLIIAHVQFVKYADVP